MNPIENLKWNAEYAKKEQFERLTKHIKDGGAITSFIGNSAEWHLDALIRVVEALPDPEPEKKLIDKLLFWKK
jgi:hypothetical protein